MFVRLSPSRVEKFLECNARWGFGELPGGTPEPGTEATEFGTLVHLARFGYYVHGWSFDLDTRDGWVAAGMSPLLPRVLPPDGGAELELTYDVEGVTLRGTLDLCYPDYNEGVAVVRDYKTTGGAAGDWRWAKLERDALFGHSQAPLYALMLMNRHGFDKALAGWVYARRPPLGPAPWPKTELAASDHYISREEAIERVHKRMVEPAKQMQAYANAGLTAADAHTLPKNLTACRKYNRWCPYLSKCQPDKDPFRMNSFLASIGAAAPAAASTPATQPAAADTPPATNTAPPQPAASEAPAAKTDGPAVNPPEGGEDGDAAGKRKTNKGATKAQDVTLSPASLEALAELVVDKMALRLTRGVK